MTLLQDFTIEDAIQVELANYDHIKLMLKEHGEDSIHRPYLIEELMGSMNNLMGTGFYLIEWFNTEVVE